MTHPTTTEVVEITSPICPACGLPTSRWDDAGAEPAGWYCDGPNDTTTAKGCHTLTADTELVERRFRSTSTYVDDFEDVREFTALVPINADDDTLDVVLQPQSGAGHFGPKGESIDAWYEIRSIDGLEPEIQWEAGG